VRVSVISQNSNRAGIRFEIQDTGIGMSDAQLGKIFTAFTPADASTARKFGGTGLGLIISRALVEAMHGDIQVSSQPGRGSTFSFHIEAGLQPNPQDDLPPLPGLRLALLEPAVMNRMNIASLLQQWQIDHTDYEHLPQLQDALEQEGAPPWQGLIISIGRHLPDSEAVRKLLHQVRQQGLPVIALTEPGSSDSAEILLQTGVSFSSSQPCTRRHLYRVLRQALQLPALPGQGQDAARNNGNKAAPVILAVDDNAANLKLVVTLLQELQLPELSATSGREAIDVVRQQNVDMILMDIQMPDMNGLEATGHIRALTERGSMRLVALTAHAMADEKEALLKAGMNDYQTKPISQEQLVNCIERWTGFRCTIQPVAPAVASAPAPLCHWVFDTAIALRHANNKADLATDM